MAEDQFAEGSVLQIEIVNILDAAGNPTTLSSAPTWTTSDPTILTLTPAADGLSADGTATKTGTVTVTATSGGVSAAKAITVIAGQAVSFELSVSIVPAPQPTA